ncbi:protein kinase C and casein kinase II substrate protein 3-like [Chelonoidis abingdonii]|uniref:protein kinase C and casein kinase II substrate protein 3-like n=1 Tax=Chelonoidis abingdonii TaxID=106734 RepID=UPI003F49395E
MGRVQKWRPLGMRAFPGHRRSGWIRCKAGTAHAGAGWSEELTRPAGLAAGQNYHARRAAPRGPRAGERFRGPRNPGPRLRKVEKAKPRPTGAGAGSTRSRGRDRLAPGGPPLAPDRQRALREERQRHTLETHKERQRYEQALAELTRASPRYVEEMESVFEQGQEFEQRRIEFLKEALAALQRRLDPTAHPGVQAAQTQLRQAISDISARQDLDWWRRQRGPGMAMAWPEFEVRPPVTESPGRCRRKPGRTRGGPLSVSKMPPRLPPSWV